MPRSQPDGRLDLSKLLQAFQQFFREHSEAHLVVFDTTPGKSWSRKIFRKKESYLMPEGI